MTYAIKCMATLLCVFFASSLLSNSASSLEDAKLRAFESGKNIFVNYTAEWCLPCQLFHEEVLEKAEVENILTNDFISIDADYDDVANQKMYTDYNVLCLPTLHVLNPEGEVLVELSGTLSKSEFLNAIRPFAKNKFIEKNNSEEIAVTYTTNSNNITTVSTSENTVTKIVDNNSSSNLENKNYYTIQTGAFRSFENARNQKNNIARLTSEDVKILQGNDERNLYYVLVGKYLSKDEYEKTVRTLKLNNVDYFIKSNKI